MGFSRAPSQIINTHMNEREEKQKFLRINILQKDYDAEEFMDYCQTNKGSVDIDSWTLAELEALVNNFVRSNAKTLKLSPFEYAPSDVTNQEKLDWDEAFTKHVPSDSKTLELNAADLDFLMGFKSDSLPGSRPFQVITPEVGEGNYPSKVPIAKDISISEDFCQKIKCKTFSKQSKLTGDYDVVVSGHEIVNPNIFVPKFVLYTINTNPLNVEVQRRMKDFDMLRSILKKVFPSAQIPHLERYGRLSEADTAVIRKQKWYIESFLNNLLMNKNIRCKILDDFLLCENLDFMKKQFAIYQKMEKPKSIQELFTPSGTIQIGLNSTYRKYINQQMCFYDYLEPCLNKARNLYEQLTISVANSSKIIQQISEVYAALRDNTKSMNGLFAEEYRSIQLEHTFDSFHILHRQWANSLKTQNKVMQTEIKHPLFKFQIANLETIRQVCKQSQMMVEAYEKRVDKEASAKEKYEGNKKLNDFKSLVDTPSKNTTVLRHQAAFFQQNGTTQNKRYMRELAEKLQKKMKIFAILQLNISNEMDSSWREFQKSVV